MAKQAAHIGFKYANKHYLPLPLPMDYRHAIADMVSEAVSAVCGEGAIISEKEGTTIYRIVLSLNINGIDLPLIITYSYRQDTGSYVEGFAQAYTV